MKLKHVLLFCSILLSATIVLAQIDPNSKPKTYALVIGINRYNNIPSLSYAATDAKSFYQLLISPVFKVAPGNAVLLTDSQATRANIFEKIYDLELKLQPNDQLIFYFAGHGDIESKIQTNNSLLLLPGIPDKNYLRSSELLEMNFLKDYFTALGNKKIKTIFICDACHSGNLIGGLEGQRVTATNLQQSWTNEVKILSCQPNELSQESKKWGNGRGTFSYFLEMAFQGLADNGDGLLSLGEVKRYIEREVATATNDRQNPIIIGDPKTFVCKVDKSILDAAKSKVLKNSGSESIAMRGLSSQNTLAIDEFKFLLSNNSFLEPSEKNAFLTAKSILSDASLKKHWVNIENDLFNYCNKHVQAIIQKYYNNEVLLPYQETLVNIIQELKATISILHNKYFIQDLQIKLDFLVIESLSLRSSAITKGTLRTFAEVLKRDLSTASSSAYLHKKYSEILYGLNNFEEALLEMNFYVSLLPNDPYAYNFAGMALVKLKKYPEAEEYLQTAIQLRPGFYDPYYNLGVLYSEKGDKSKARYYFEKANRAKEVKVPLSDY